MVLILAACSFGEDTRPKPTSGVESDSAVENVTVCEAADAGVGSRIQVSGEFDGFGYATESLMVTLKTSELCNDDGAGLIFAELSSSEEREELLTTRPGTTVTLEGRITKVEEGRFTHIEEAAVR